MSFDVSGGQKHKARGHGSNAYAEIRTRETRKSSKIVGAFWACTLFGLSMMHRKVHCALDFLHARVPAPMGISEDGTPFSELYGDVYFSQAGALAEYAHVFHAGQALGERFASASQGFAIGELGFGTGLGFVATASLWSACASKHSTGVLHYVSFEKHPLMRAELERIHALQLPRGEACPGSAFHRDWSERLLRAWKPHTPGFHRLRFDEARVVLDVYVGDALEGLRRSEITPRDAWFLHGFAPSKNPDLWSEALFEKLARRPGTTLSTFSVSHGVQRKLQEQGWAIELKEGFGPKRQMLTASFAHAKAPERPGFPWFRAAEPPPVPARVAVVGGGIAGASLARAFARRGVEVLLLERESALAAQASGNPAALLMPRLSAEPNPRSEIVLRCSAYALEAIAATPSARKNLSGHRVAIPDAQERERVARALRTAGVSQEFARLGEHTLDYANAGWVCAPELVRAWCEDPRIDVRRGVEARAFADGALETSAGVLRADAVVWARGASALSEEVRAIQGQWAFVRPDGALNESLTLAGSSWIPGALPDGRGVLGATYSKVAREMEFIPARSEALLEEWRARGYDPQLTGEGRACFRAVTPDVLPLMGWLPDPAFYAKAYADLRKGKSPSLYPDARALPGQWVLTGLGSHGFLMAPLLAECLAAQLCGESVPMEVDLLEALHPARFRIRSFLKSPLAKRDSPRDGGGL